jgi:hypothetical protein
MRRQIQIVRRVAWVLAAGWVLWDASVYALPNSSPIQQQAAEAVVRDLKLEAASEIVERNLEVMAPFTALAPGATIHVISARAGFAGTWLLRLDCAARRDCLPFYATLQLPEEQRPQLAGTAIGAKLLRKPPPAGRRPEAALVHRGQAVTLLEELSGLRLRTKAVCLEPGGLGDEVRVQNRSTHRVLTASVAGENLVKVQR